MAKYQAKTTENKNSVSAFIRKISEPQKAADAFELIEIMKKQSGLEPKMWGPAIVGFGTLHFKYDSGHEGDVPLIAFSPRKAGFTLYLSTTFDKKDELLEQFGKHTISKACIYFKKMADINVSVLKKMITASLKYTKATKSPC